MSATVSRSPAFRASEERTAEIRASGNNLGSPLVGKKHL
jgi:hypothetical protein